MATVRWRAARRSIRAWAIGCITSGFFGGLTASAPNAPGGWSRSASIGCRAAVPWSSGTPRTGNEVGANAGQVSEVPPTLRSLSGASRLGGDSQPQPMGGAPTALEATRIVEPGPLAEPESLGPGLEDGRLHCPALGALLSEVAEFRRRFGHGHVPAEWAENINLGRWVVKTRRLRSGPSER